MECEKNWNNDHEQLFFGFFGVQRHVNTTMKANVRDKLSYDVLLKSVVNIILVV